MRGGRGSQSGRELEVCTHAHTHIHLGIFWKRKKTGNNPIELDEVPPE